jgi:exoribonuclease II
MSNIQHPLNKNSSSNALERGNLVMFENEQNALIGVILDLKKDRFLVFSERAREVELAPQRLHKLPGLLSATAVTREKQQASLQDIRAKAEELVEGIAIEELWGVVQGSSREYSESELYELLFDKPDASAYLALRLKLLQDKVFFKRDKAGFIPRTSEIIDELRRAEIARQAKRELEIETVEFISKRLAGEHSEIPSRLRSIISLLEECAAGSERIDHSKQKDVKEILQLFTDRSHIELRGTIEEKSFELLSRIGLFHKNTNLVLYRYNPRISFSEDALKEAETIQPAQSIEGIADSLRSVVRDLTHLELVTIDDSSTKDMDDGLSIEQTRDGFRLGVHISNVALMLPEGGALEREALLRATSIYNSDLTINMLPESLSEDRLSLRAGVVRPALSCLFELDHRFSIVRREVSLSLVRVARRLSYDEVDNFLAHDDHDLTLLYNIASHLEQQRIEGGAVRVQKGDAIVVLNAEGTLSLMEIDEQSPARSLVGEMMVLANGYMAEFAKEQKIPLIFRGQPQPDKTRSIDPRIPDGPAREYAIRSLLKKSTLSFEPQSHASLGLSAYAQISSPIRRYADIINQRQLVNFLIKGQARYDSAALQKITESTEDSLARANQITRETKRFWLLRYLEETRSEKAPLWGTIIRTDLKQPIIELESTYLSVPIKHDKPVKAGDRVQVRINSVKPHSDQIRLEIVG